MRRKSVAAVTPGVPPYAMAFTALAVLVGDVDNRNIFTFVKIGARGAGDGGAATDAQFRYARGMALDSAGNLYVSDGVNRRVRRRVAYGLDDVTSVSTVFRGRQFFGNRLLLLLSKRTLQSSYPPTFSIQIRRQSVFWFRPLCRTGRVGRDSPTDSIEPQRQPVHGHLHPGHGWVRKLRTFPSMNRRTEVLQKPNSF